jgi:hypothetical protein
VRYGTAVSVLTPSSVHRRRQRIDERSGGVLVLEYGLYQTAAGRSAEYSFSQEAGTAMYKELESPGLTNSTYEHWDSAVDGAWMYNPVRPAHPRASVF